MIAVNACQNHAAARPIDASALALVCAKSLLKLHFGNSSSGGHQNCEILSTGVRQCLRKAPEPVTAAAVIAAELAEAITCEEPFNSAIASFETASRLGVELQVFAAESIASGRSLCATTNAALSSAAKSIRSILTSPKYADGPRRRAVLTGLRFAMAEVGPEELIAPVAIARYILGVWGAEVVASAACAEGESSSSDEALKLLLSLTRALPPAEQSVVLVALIGALTDCASNGGDIAKRLLHAVIRGTARVDRVALKEALANLDETQKSRLAQCMQPAAQSPACSSGQPTAPAGGLRPPTSGRPPAIFLKRF